MKRLLTTAATALVMGTGAYAESHSMETGAYEVSPDDFYATNLIGMRLYSSEQELGENGDMINFAEQEWDDIGEINDFIVTEDGSVQAVIVGVGGFLGIGEKDVAVTMDQIRTYDDENGDRFLVINSSQEALEAAPAFERASQEEQMAAEPGMVEETGMADATAEGDAAATAVATTETAEGETEVMETETAEGDTAMAEAEAEVETELAEGEAAMAEAEAELETEMAEGEAALEEGAAELETEMAEGEAALEEGAAELETEMAEGEAAIEEGAAELEAEMAEGEAAIEEGVAEAETEMAEGEAAMTGAAALEGYSEAAVTDLSVEQLNGVTVYGAGDENIGEIEDLVATDGGEITEAVIGVGGFLGLGEKKVAVNFSDLQILTNEDKSDIRVYISATEDELKGLPEYEPEAEIQQ